MMDRRRAIRNMSQRRRHEGLSPFEIHTIVKGLSTVVRILTLAVTIPPSLVKIILFMLATSLCLYLYLHTYPTKLQRLQKDFGRVVFPIVSKGFY
jgi:Flp pilus assembly protein TadB